MTTHAWQRLNSYDEDYGLDGRGDDDDDSCDYDDDDSGDSDGDDDASCATLALRSCIITAGRRPTHAIAFSSSSSHLVVTIIVIMNSGTSA